MKLVDAFVQSMIYTNLKWENIISIFVNWWQNDNCKNNNITTINNKNRNSFNVGHIQQFDLFITFN